MKIMQVMAGGPHGGAETAYVDMCIAMHEAGQDVLAVTRANPVRVPALQKAGVPVLALPFGGAFDIWTEFRLRQIIKGFQPDIVQTWMARAASKTPNWRGPKDGKPFVTCARLGGYYKLKHYTRTDAFVTITPDLKVYLINNGIEESRIRFINNFAEMENASKAVDRECLNTPEDAFVFLSLSRLHEAKALDTLLHAAAKVPKAFLWLAGEGPDRDKLESLSHTLDLEDRVRFLGWRSDRAALFAASDACAFPSRHEPFGTVFVQAWQAQKPLVVSAAQGASQFVRNGEDGLMFPIDDVDRLAQAMQNIIDDPALREKLVRNGYHRYQSEFTKDKVVSAYLNWYERLLKSSL